MPYRNAIPLNVFNNQNLSTMSYRVTLTNSNVLSRTLRNVMVIRSFLFMTTFVLFSLTSYSQATKRITGTVLSDLGVALENVSVNIRNSQKGTLTGSDGKFSIDAAEGTVLLISSVGYEATQLRIGRETEYTVRLKSVSEALDQVVVIGYGSQKKSTLTGAIASVDNKTLNQLPVAGIDQALQGRVSGLTVTNNGSPGTSPVIAIRGISSINGTSDPLYVIDGVPTGSLITFDSRDVESVEILKDASSASIYGSRATNGVILITTKKGKRSGKATVNFESFVGLQSPAKTIDLLNTNQYKQFATALLGAANLPPRLLDSNFNKPTYPGSPQTFAQTNTDWQEEYFRRNAFFTQSNVSLTGGNDVSRYYVSSGYFDQDGIAQGLGFKRGNFRINSDHIISKVFTFGENLFMATTDQQYEGTGGNRSPLTNVIRMQPYLPVRNPTNPNGGFIGPISSFDGSDPTNPVEPAVLHEYHNKQLKILGSAYVEAKLTSFLKFRSTFGLDYSNNLNRTYVPIYDDGGTLKTLVANISRTRDLFTTLLYTQQLNFDKTFGKHHIGATAVYEYQGQNFNQELVSGSQSTNAIRVINGGSNITGNYTKGVTNIESYVGRVTYDYASKYLLSGSFRRDGSSVWAPGNKYTNFPSASVGWRIDQESFMQNAKNISELKLRAGYGLTGLNPAPLGSYPWQVTVQQNASLYPFAGTGSEGLGSYYDLLGNRDLSWEITKQLNFGIDLGLFKNKLSFVAEYFKRKTDNLILSVPTAFSQGFNGGGVFANVAAMENKGFELQTAYHKTNGKLRWDVTGLISTVKNKVLRLNTDNGSIGAGGDADFGGGASITNTRAGESVQYFYGFVTDGIFQNAAEIAAAPTQNGAAPGDIRFKDLNGDKQITDADRTNLGSFIPKFTYSLNYSVNFMGFDGTIFFQGVQGNKIFNAERIIGEGMLRLFNASTAVLNAWTPTNTGTSVPRAINSDPNQNARVSDRWIEDGSFLRLKNASLGYNIPAAKIGQLTRNAISRLRLYVSGQNLITFTKYKGWDPEVGNRRGALTNGIDYGQYPSARSVQFGLQVGF